jgi:hypothetical protein
MLWWCISRTLAAAFLVILPFWYLPESGGRALVLLNLFLVLRCSTVPLIIMGAAQPILVAAAHFADWAPGIFLQAQTLVALVVLCSVGLVNARVTELPPLDRRHFETGARLMRASLWLLLVTGLLTALFGPYPALFSLSWAVIAFLLGASLSEEIQWESHRIGLAEPALVALVLVFMIGAGEIAARILFDGVYSPDQLTRADPATLYRLRSNVDLKLNVLMEKDTYEGFRIRTSSLGLREKELGKKQPGETRILLLGDSYTFGIGVAEEDTVSARLEDRLRASGGEETYTVINGGTGGFGPWQSLGLLLDVVDTVDPDIVILQTFMANDIGDTLRRDRVLLEAYDPQYERPLRLMGYWEVALHHKLRITSRLYDTYCRVVPHRYWLYAALSNCRLTRELKLKFDQPPAERPWIYEADLRKWYPALWDGWKAMQKDILALRETCHARGIRMGLYNVVWPFKREDAIVSLHSYGIKEGYDLDKGNRMIEAWAEDQGIPFMPMLERVREHPDPRELWNTSNGHFTPAGSEYYALWLEDFIARAYANKDG